MPSSLANQGATGDRRPEQETSKERPACFDRTWLYTARYDIGLPPYEEIYAEGTGRLLAWIIVLAAGLVILLATFAFL